MERLRISNNGRYLVREDGSPFIWLADTAWTVPARLKWDDVHYYMQTRKKQGFTVLEMIKTLEEVSGREVPYQIAGRREGDPPVLVASNDKARSVLGWEPSHSGIHEILSDAWKWENNKRY